MTAPRLEIDLGKIGHNARTLVGQLADRGISVTGVTKATLGSPEIAGAFLEAGARELGDSRIENVERLRAAGVTAPLLLLRSPMISDVERVVAHASSSLNTELDVISSLSQAAERTGRVHGVLLMVELGDLREGIMPADLGDVVRQTLGFPNILLRGIGTNLACRNGVSPDSNNMAELSQLAAWIETAFEQEMVVVSGGNSANIPWALGGGDRGRINNLRLGESLLLGREPLNRTSIEGLHTDAIVLVAEVIESNEKPTLPTGEIHQSAFGEMPRTDDRGHTWQTILAVGRQDIDPAGVEPPEGFVVRAASSDHLVIDSDHHRMPIGAEVSFQLNYSALVRAMTSPFVAKVYQHPVEPDVDSAPSRSSTGRLGNHPAVH